MPSARESLARIAVCALATRVKLNFFFSFGVEASFNNMQHLCCYAECCLVN